MMIANAGEKLMARIAPSFVQFYETGTIGTRRTIIVSSPIALFLTVVTFGFAAVYKVDYAAQAAAGVVTIPLAVLSFRGGEVFDRTAGTVAV